jgi:hypothetical protein
MLGLRLIILYNTYFPFTLPLRVYYSALLQLACDLQVHTNLELPVVILAMNSQLPWLLK